MQKTIIELVQKKLKNSKHNFLDCNTAGPACELLSKNCFTLIDLPLTKTNFKAIAKKRRRSETRAENRRSVSFKKRKLLSSIAKSSVRIKNKSASANANDNNDNSTAARTPIIQGEPSTKTKIFETSAQCCDNRIGQTKCFDNKAPSQQVIATNHQVHSLKSFAESKLKSFLLCSPFTDDLEESSKTVCDINNKRRYNLHLPKKTEKLELKSKKDLNKLFHFKGKLHLSTFNSPPSRIPRFFRRSQSAFCEAREVVEANELLLSKSIPHCYRRYNSWSNESGKQLFHQSSHDFSNFPFETSLLEFNSNANATSHKQSQSDRILRLVNKPDCLHEKKFSCSNVIGTKNKKNFFESVNENFVLEEDWNETSTFFNKNIKERKTENSIRYIGRPDSCEHSNPLNPNRTDLCPGEKDIESLARLKVNGPGSLSCICGKQQVLRRYNSCHIYPQAFEDQKGPFVCDQKVLNFCCLRNRKKSKSSLQSEKNFSSLFSSNLTKSGQALESTSISSKNFFHPNTKFSNLVKPRDKVSNSALSSSQKHLIQSSTNNHNVKKEISCCVANKQDTTENCCTAYQFIFNHPHSISNKVATKFIHVEGNKRTKSFSLRKDSASLCYEQKRTDMGCIHSAQKKRVEPCQNSIYSDVCASIDQSPTIIEEYSPIVLRYRTPYFRAHAQVIMPPIPNKETWTVGWIQACDYMTFINQYGDLGYSSWEIPALKANRVPAVSDSDGVSYPWYGNTTEIATIVGPTDSYTRMNLTMNDNFYPSVTWDIPVSEGTNAHLTKIVRDQSFITWLAAINETTKEIIILKTVRWSFYLEIKIDPSKELGFRARVVTPPIQNQPSVTNGPCEKHHVGTAVKMRRRVTANNSNSNCINHIPMSALVRPSANNAQTLVWRPTNSPPVVVVPAKEEHKDTNELVLFNGCSAMHGKEAIMKEISKKELIQMQQLTR